MNLGGSLILGFVIRSTYFGLILSLSVIESVRQQKQNSSNIWEASVILWETISQGG